MTDGEARDLLVDLVGTRSVSGDEGACAERLAAFFEGRGREVRIDEVGNVRAPADDGVLLTSHVDTVPGDIPVEVSEGALWGRGSVDAKGSLASMAVAAVRTGASFAGVVGEETDSRGARFLVEDRDAPDAVVNGEPSGWDGVTFGYRGLLRGRYETSTESAHTSRPDPNAVQRAIEWWSRVETAFGGDADGRRSSASPESETPESAIFERVTAKPVGFEGGTAADGLSVEADVDVEFRIPPGETAAEVRETVEADLRGGDVSWVDPVPPVMESPRTAVGRAFRTAIREEGGDPRLLRKTGTSDMNHYAEAWDCPVATYGPGDSALDHAPNERLDLAEFDRAIDVLERVADALTGGDGR